MLLRLCRLNRFLVRDEPAAGLRGIVLLNWLRRLLWLAGLHHLLLRLLSGCGFLNLDLLLLLTLYRSGNIRFLLLVIVAMLGRLRLLSLLFLRRSCRLLLTIPVTGLVAITLERPALLRMLASF